MHPKDSSRNEFTASVEATATASDRTEPADVARYLTGRSSPHSVAALVLAAAIVVVASAIMILEPRVEVRPHLAAPWLILVTLLIYLMPGPGLGTKSATAATALMVFVAVGFASSWPIEALAMHALAGIVAIVTGASAAHWYGRELEVLFERTRELKRLVDVDEITGIYSRRGFEDHIRRMWRQSRRNRANLSLLIIDIDYFTAFNKRYGASQANHCLKRIAGTLGACARRPLDFVARYGGNEFALVLYDPPTSYIKRLVLNIQTEIASLHIPNQESQIGPRVTVSIGAVVLGPDTSKSMDGALLFAEEALRQAKVRGRNRAIVFQSSDLDRQDRSDGEAALAIGDG